MRASQLHLTKRKADAEMSAHYLPISPHISTPGCPLTVVSPALQLALAAALALPPTPRARAALRRRMRLPGYLSALLRLAFASGGEGKRDGSPELLRPLLRPLREAQKPAVKVSPRKAAAAGSPQVSPRKAAALAAAEEARAAAARRSREMNQLPRSLPAFLQRLVTHAAAHPRVLARWRGGGAGAGWAAAVGAALEEARPLLGKLFDAHKSGGSRRGVTLAAFTALLRAKGLFRTVISAHLPRTQPASRVLVLCLYPLVSPIPRVPLTVPHTPRGLRRCMSLGSLT